VVESNYYRLITFRTNHEIDEEIKERRIRQVSTASAGLTERGAQFGD
jgi:hypothetical protein